MEAQLEDIRRDTTIKFVKQLKGTIIDCAKNIKSNDATFGINTLSEAKDTLTNLMTDYVNIVHDIESYQRNFINFQMKSCGVNEEQLDDYIDIKAYEEEFKSAVENDQELCSEIDAHVDLDKIILPEPVQNQDEDLYLEQDSLQIPKDPITKKDIKIAVRSKVCRHVYDKDGLEDYFQQKEKRKAKVQCPQAGCTNKNMTRDELELDDKLNRLIQSQAI